MLLLTVVFPEKASSTSRILSLFSDRLQELTDITKKLVTLVMVICAALDILAT